MMTMQDTVRVMIADDNFDMRLLVRATLGGSSWTTSIFPDKARSTYILPIKRAIRTAESLTPGDVPTVSLELLDV